MKYFRAGRMPAAAFLLLGSAISTPALATSWGADAGDAQTRSDIELLAATGAIDAITSSYPLAWSSIEEKLQHANAPAYISGAARRVLAQAEADTGDTGLSASLDTDFASAPATVRGFDALGRQAAQGQAILDYSQPGFAIHLAAGARTSNPKDRQVLMLDGSYAAAELGGAVVYAGYVPHWWGPGWRTALSLSTNARPFPSIGITRAGTTPFKTPLLSWMGPWQAEFFVGVLDGPRINSNTLFSGLRVAINPLPGLELALSRTQQFCGTGQPCDPIQGFFDVYNDPARINKTKNQANIDLRYTSVAMGIPFSLYAQVMNRDTGPFTHSASNHVIGTSLWLPVHDTTVRVTAEYASTISTHNIFSFGNYFPGITYEDGQYRDGWNYRGRTMGSSLGTDSRLASLQASFMGGHGISYSFTFDRAQVGSTLPGSVNRLTPTPVTIHAGEMRMSFPLGLFKFDLAGRIQDDQLRPRSGFLTAVESRIRMDL